MSCRCYEIGGPFIGADPDCEVHRDGGLYEQVEALGSRVRQLEEEIARLRVSE